MILSSCVVDDERYDTLTLYTDIDKTAVLNSDQICIEKDHFFKISYNEKIKPFSIEEVKFEFEKTKVYWLNWCYKTPTFDNAYNEQILRSAITLKLLTFEKTGAVLAAATTLPTRNHWRGEKLGLSFLLDQRCFYGDQGHYQIRTS